MPSEYEWANDKKNNKIIPIPKELEDLSIIQRQNHYLRDKNASD
jgi:hypothetical protein